MELKTSQLHQARFEGAVSTQFMMSPEQLPASQVSVTLTSVEGRRAPKGYEQYSMVFLGPQEPLFAQGIYKFGHPQIGDTPLFAVPIASDARGTQYEVCVTRTVEPFPADAT